ncbi:biosynthetic-type acetolactate synthase large subunit [Kingella kingae]|uniref:Acetolactate synthase n=2 Tax=Kingella kingae TaxID=504 RepID=F5S5Z4_KINKI|nr:biosynthetic-type acetolactate synthase large subunit [Kingella kingae]EGK10473.1 acetolactate synthase large subunit [Kingella kingae ATCC 23330]MDK4534005.1 biosynthetic-type acetolactate synthase large subunit [Kingella kingae]MDK4540371.1 biosynthetic-type acetolactate synthase large subunit [Kingella kingae]MDK4553037.1 biosynthetic-type acetolactate synthase large subunit [Kingella kingae]UOP03832.1 biosynthetic-type acetolactate synthase large subunit [Kingella kingae]
MQLTGAQILVHSLKAENVEYVFGYPGGAVLEIYDAIYQLHKFEHILTRHEQAAVHAADAYARTSGKVGVALVTSGPGATNAITGIATAYTDSIPIVVISGQVASPAIGSDAFQEIDMIGISRPCVKHNFLVTHIDDLVPTIKKAFQIAKTGRPGPVVVDIAKDVTQASAKFSYPQEDIFIRSYQPVVNGHVGQIKKALQMLAAAKRPLIYFGGGVVLGNAHQVLTDFVRTLGVPCTGTLMGLGAYPSSDKQFLGMLGMHGTYQANLAMQNADVVLAIGARFDDRVVSVPSKFLENGKKIIQIDIDPSSIAKRVKVDVPIVGDVANVLTEMLGLWQKQELTFNPSALEKWWKTVENWCSRDCLRLPETADSELILPQYVVQTLARVTNNDAIVTSDVGQHQMFAAQYYPFERPRQWLNSGGLGTMGVGLPYAMGAYLADPSKDVCCITGEGSIQMNIQELSTCFQYKLPLKVICLNNGYLGMVRQWQELYYSNRESETYFDSLPDFVKLAEAYGHVGMRITKKSDVEGALREALAMKDRFVFLDFITDSKQNVYPMVGNGKALDEMVLPLHMRETKADSDVNDIHDRNYDTRSVP